MEQPGSSKQESYMSKKSGKDADKDEGKTASSSHYSHEPDHSGLPHPPERPHGKPRSGKDFGEEGTNKTVATPKPNGAESEELDNNMSTIHIEKSPYTRG